MIKLRSCPQPLKLPEEKLSFGFFKCECKNQLCNEPDLTSEKQSCTFTFLQDLINQGKMPVQHVKALSEDAHNRNYMCNSTESSKERLNITNQTVEFYGTRENGKKFLREIRGENEFEFLPFESQPLKWYAMRISPVNHWCDTYRIFANMEITDAMLADCFRPRENPLGISGTLAHLLYNQQPEQKPGQKPFVHNRELRREQFAEKRVYYKTRQGWLLQGKFDGLMCLRDKWEPGIRHLAVIDRKRKQMTTQKDQLLVYGLGVCQALGLEPESILTIVERTPFTPEDYKANLPGYRETVFDIFEFEYSRENPYVLELEDKIDRSINAQKSLLQNSAEFLRLREAYEPLKEYGCTDCFANDNCKRFCEILRQVSTTPIKLLEHYHCLPENYSLRELAMAGGS